ncbi:hypothetical protein DFH07DRAFT_751970 [Mycena maculata]|uniref:Glycosyltransferase family 18 catalytic domain-containing protein n=1 Tax=Mycena maculata TaxID=230809 RepID=A0AAD7ICH6_9AGAR|nr:hypothetical protein DFH07DRAFT_751970 [Mycena maculata]
MPVKTLPKDWLSHNDIAIQGLFRCLETSTCGENQTKVVVLGYNAFLNEIEESHEGGEVVWCKSTVRALGSLGYTYLYTQNNERTLQLYHIFRGLIKAIFIEEQETNACFNDPKCVMSSRNPSGIPVWKMFNFNWWTGAVGPLANNWTLNPEDYRLEGKGYAPNKYLGYSIEPGCSMRPFIPHAERERRAYVLAKEMHYFGPKIRAWDPDFYDAAYEAVDIEFVSGVRGEPTTDFPHRLKNLGYMTPKRFYDQLSRSLVLVGVGFPLTSPTPYDALCLGVPFINPVMDWDVGDPLNRDKWSVQHGMLKHLEPPYVYHVFKGDRDGFVKAVKDAVAHPIDSYILDRMTMQAVERRLGNILSADWETEALTFCRGRACEFDS